MSKIIGIAVPGTYITPLIETLLIDNDKRKEDAQLPVLKLGTGLIYFGEDVLAVRAGLLHFLKPNRFWVESHQKRVFHVALLCG